MKPIPNSFRQRLLFVLLAMLCTFALASVGSNALFLERFYVLRSRTVLEQARQKVANVIASGEDIDSFIRVLDRSDGIHVLISSGELTVTHSSFPMFEDGGGDPRLPGELARVVQDLQRQPKANSAYELVSAPDSSTPEIALVSRLPGGAFLVLRKSLKALSESAAIASQFSLFVGAGLMVVGGFVISVFARRVARPVTEMSYVAKAMAGLDFSRRVHVDSGDEIGSLGDSINQMAERLDAAVKALRDDVLRRKQLFRDMSHELKTPIGVIKGYAEALRFGVAPDPAQYCEVIAAECDRMDGMVKELLELSTLESGGRELRVQECQLLPLSKGVAQRFGQAAVQRGITLSVQVQEQVAVNGDCELLERALSNFMTNALRHTPAGGQIAISAERHGDTVEVSVHNTGSSVAPEDLDRIWDAFYRADRARTRESGGQGLGLAITRTIVGMHGGSCKVENVDDGVTFSMSLPMQQASR